MNNKTKKKALKSIIALVLCMATIIGSIGAGASTASAAKKYNLVMKFNGKSVTIAKDVYKKCTVTSFEKLKKTLGNPKKKTSKSEETTYTWKKGKTIISYTPNTVFGNILEIYIDDKNGSTFGVKVGMKKSTAMKKLKEKLDSKKFDKSMADYVHLGFGFGSGGSLVWFKNGKVSSISYYLVIHKK